MSEAATSSPPEVDIVKELADFGTTYAGRVILRRLTDVLAFGTYIYPDTLLALDADDATQRAYDHATTNRWLGRAAHQRSTEAVRQLLGLSTEEATARVDAYVAHLATNADALMHATHIAQAATLPTAAGAASVSVAD